MKLICKVWAHDYGDDQYGTPYGIFKCNRCGEVTDYNDEHEASSLNIAGKLWWKWERIKSWFYRKTRYFQKCHDCGKRWNKHTEDCPPF